MDIFIICKWGKLLNFFMELGNNTDRFTQALQTITFVVIYFSFFLYKYFDLCRKYHLKN
jgi:hypothetical protein